MIGFYYGTSEPGISAKEGIYFVKSDNKYSIYTKRDNENAIKYGETNEVTTSSLDALWESIGENFVAKTFTVAGLSLDNNISIAAMQNALQLQSLAYKSEASGTLNCITEVQGTDYLPTGTVEVILGYGETAIVSTGKYTPKGSISGTVVAQGHADLEKNDNGFEIKGSVSAPEINLELNTEKIKSILTPGTLPTYTPASYTAPSLTDTKSSFATEGVTASIEGTVLIFTSAKTEQGISELDWNAGSYIDATFDAGSLPTMSEELSVASSVKSVSAEAPKFTGEKIAVQFTGEQSNINATFTGTEETIQVTGTYDKANVKSTEFTGDSTTIIPNVTKGDKTVTVQ